MHRETHKENLKQATFLSGNENNKELEDIYVRALDINGINLLNDIRRLNN